MFRRTIFVAALAAIALLAVACGGGANPSGGSPAGALDVTVNNTEFKFDPAVINAKPGQTINLTVVNKGSIVHTWVLPSQNIKLTIPVGQSLKRTFTAPTTPGTYDIVCDEAGHKESGMVGQLVVK